MVPPKNIDKGSAKKHLQKFYLLETETTKNRVSTDVFMVWLADEHCVCAVTTSEGLIIYQINQATDHPWIQMYIYELVRKLYVRQNNVDSNVFVSIMNNDTAKTFVFVSSTYLSSAKD